MSKANDENNFVKAYGENEVSFQNFDENTDPQDQLQNSAFSLIRQIAKEQDEKEYPESLLGNGDGLKDHDSVMSLIKGQHSTPVNFKQDPINIAHIAKPLKNRSSLISFLREDNDDVGFAARAPIDYPRDNYSFNNQKNDLKNSSYSEKYSDKYSEIHNNTNDSETTKSKGRFSALFKSNHETSSTNEDSLQAIYKRLLKCQ